MNSIRLAVLILFFLGGVAQQTDAQQVGPDDRFVNLWNSGTGELINQIPSSIDALYDGVFGLAWSPDGAYLIAISFDTFQFWETTSWTALEPSRSCISGKVMLLCV